ncbi:MAG: sel1 repeat family protein, partial [Synergistaceae bacterium]|nr:sel1 repeat family protein [Synergistaceae bacterium]
MLRKFAAVMCTVMFLGTVTAFAEDSGSFLGALRGLSMVYNLQRKAESGDSASQFMLGNLYNNGEIVSQDKSEAAKWYAMAAENGHSNAQYNLAQMYRNGNGVIQDKAKAAELYTKAAKQGLPEAQYNLGVMYYNGDGVEKDLRKAF